MITLQKASHYYNGQTHIPLPDLVIRKGGELLISGPSGSGKSTLLHVLGGLLRPDRGELHINGICIYSLKEKERDCFRGRNIGIIFQQMHLISSLTVQKNLELAQFMAGEPVNQTRIYALCKDLEIDEKLHSYIEELSQGQRQRVAIARAVVNSPLILLADEPTSSLDDERAENVIRLLRQQAKRCNAVLIISTHDQRVKSHFSRIVDLGQLKGGEVL